MSARKRRRTFIVMGQDGAVPYIVEEGIKEGYLEGFSRLKEEGVLTPLLSHPSGVTPGNWAALATGAPCGKIGISDFTVHIPGEPLGQEINAFGRDLCQAEFIWDTLSKIGLKTATISYPGSRPRGLEGHVSMGGHGMPTEDPGYCSLTKAQCFVTSDIELADPYRWKEHQTVTLLGAKSWKGLPHRVETAWDFDFSLMGHRYFCLVYRMGKDETVLISREKDFRGRLASVREGEWSAWVKTGAKDISGAFRVRPLKIDCRKPSFKMYVSPLNRLDSFTDPAEYGPEFTSLLGVYQEPLNISALLTGWLDAEGFLDEFREQALWQAKAVVKLTRDMGFSGVLSKWHGFDKFYHLFFQKIDSISPHFEGSRFDYYEGIHREILKIADEMVRFVLGEKDEDTLLVVCSDHGLLPSVRHPSVPNFLIKHGFTSVKQSSNGNLEIDWKKTKAVLFPSVQIWVNLKGRDPQGVVEPGSEYERVRDDIVELLRSWKDPETGRCIMSHAFKTEDGAFYGLGGERDGDIRFFTSPGYSVYRDRYPTRDGVLVKNAQGPYLGDHGSCEPTARFGRGSETAMLTLHGPGVRQGCAPKLYPRVIDIMPTICHLCGFPLPANSEGGVLRDLLS